MLDCMESPIKALQQEKNRLARERIELVTALKNCAYARNQKSLHVINAWELLKKLGEEIA